MANENHIAEHMFDMPGPILADKMPEFSRLWDTSPDAMLILNDQGRLYQANWAAVRLYGFSNKQQLLSRRIPELSANVQSDGIESVEKMRYIFDITRQKGSYRFEWIHKRPDGQPFICSVLLSRIDVSQGTLYQVTVRDITDQKAAEADLLQKERDLKVIFNTTPVGMLLLDEQMVVEEANDAVGQMLGRHVCQVAGKKLGSALNCVNAGNAGCQGSSECSSCAIMPNLKQVFDNRQRVEALTVPLAVVQGSGRRLFWLQISADTIMLRNAGHLLLTISDVTEQKLAKEQLRQAKESAEQANKQLQAVNDELKEFAYIVSHDLKAPLRGIKTLIEWISCDYAEKFDRNGRKQLQLVQSRADRMHNLIDGILQYSRIGRVKMQQEPVDLNDLVSEVLDMVSIEDNIELSISPDMPTLICERTRIMQVFENLISNAAKYIDKPRGKISIGFERQEQFWRFSVSDNGPGIDQKDFERIFNIFQTLAPKDEFESTGIGLTVVRKIVQCYGGKIYLVSERGKGSTFYFTLPASLTAEQKCQG